MKWVYNLGGQSKGPLVRDWAVKTASATLPIGSAMTLNTTTNGCTLGLITPTTGAFFVGITNEPIPDPSKSPALAFKDPTLTSVPSGTLVFVKVITEPLGVFRATHDVSAPLAVASATATTLTLAVATDDDQDGGWVVVIAGTGKGQIAWIGAATTTVLTISTAQNWKVIPDNTSTVLIIRRVGRPPAGSGIDLTTDTLQISNASTQTGEFLNLENYIQAYNINLQPLRPNAFHMYTGLDALNAQYSSDLYPMTHLLRNTNLPTV